MPPSWERLLRQGTGLGVSRPSRTLRVPQGAAVAIQALVFAPLFFNGHFPRRAVQDQGTMVAVFWAGLAVWLLFAIAPLRMLLGLVPRRRRCARCRLPPRCWFVAWLLSNTHDI